MWNMVRNPVRVGAQRHSHLEPISCFRERRVESQGEPAFYHTNEINISLWAMTSKVSCARKNPGATPTIIPI